MNKLIIVLALLVSSCASQAEREWSDWRREGVAARDMTWRFCNQELDGTELHHKGFCYQSQECRTRKTILGNTKKECRRAVLFCSWGDIECLQYHNILQRIIITQPQGEE